MNADFSKYVHDRLNDSNIVSSVEKQLVSSVDQYDLTDTVKLLYIKKDYLVIYEASVKLESTPKRVTIDRIGEDTPHSLSTLLNADIKIKKERESLFSYSISESTWLYDDYFSKYLNLNSILDELKSLFTSLGICSSDTVLICENEFNGPIVEYILQSIAKKCITIFAPSDDVSINGRIQLNKSILTRNIGVNFPMNTIWGLISNKENIYVPLDESTLSSIFYQNIIWRNLLGSLSDIDKSVVEIAGYHCRLIRLTPYIDCYGNIFISVYSPLNKHCHNLLIGGPGMECLNQSENYPENNVALSKEKVPESDENKTLNTKEDKGYRRSEAKNKHQLNGSKGGSSTKSSENISSSKANSSLHQSKNRFDTHKEIIFMEETIKIGIMESQISQATNVDKLRAMLETVENVFRRIARVERIVTDTNIWITEDSSRRGKMLYENMLNFVRKFMIKGQNVYELHREVFDEIVKLANDNKAAAKQAKTYLSSCQEMRLLEIIDLDWNTNYNPYADPVIGERVLKLYKDGISFSIITNDADAKIRWVNALQQLEKHTNPENRRAFPPCILSRDLYSLYLLRGKLILRLKHLENK